MLIPFTDNDIIVDIPDFIDGTTRIKRKAEVLDFNYSPRKRSVTIIVALHPFAAIEGSEEYGAPLADHPCFKVEEIHIIANNSTLVDAMTGEILVPQFGGGDNEIEALSEPGGVLENRTVRKEFEYYSFIAKYVPVTVNDAIERVVKRKYGMIAPNA